MKVGDIIQVLKIENFRGTKKIPARVISVRPEKFEVDTLSGSFDEEGHDRVWLLVSERSRTWE